MKKSLAGIVMALLVAACGEDRSSEVVIVDTDAGRTIAEDNCSGCHGLDGHGKTAEIPNLAAQPAQYLVEAMYAYRGGNRRHHAALQELITGFSEADILNIAGYFAGLPSTASEPLAEESQSAYREGAEVAAKCTVCHGDRGISNEPGVPSLAGQQPAYLMVATQEYASGERGHVEKVEMLQGLGQVDIEKMAMYFAAQAPGLREPPPFGDIQAGQPLTAVCGSCHGINGVSPDPLVPNLAGQEPTYLINAIKAYRSHERSHEDMVANKSDEEIQNIAAFYSVQAVEPVVEENDRLNQVIAKCERCHGPVVGESSMVVPTINGQQQEYLFRVMKQYRDEDRGSSMMHKMSSGYSDELLLEIATFYANHP
jgi:cytochrome c553